MLFEPAPSSTQPTRSHLHATETMSSNRKLLVAHEPLQPHPLGSSLSFSLERIDGVGLSGKRVAGATGWERARRQGLRKVAPVLLFLANC